MKIKAILLLIGLVLILSLMLAATQSVHAAQVSPDIQPQTPTTDSATVVFLPVIGGPTRVTPPPTNGAIIVDHTSIALFDRIPEQYLTAARNLRMVYMDRSVGQNINEALDCLTASSWGASSSACRRDYIQTNTALWEWQTFTQTDLSAGRVPGVIQFSPNATRYNRSNWSFYMQDQNGWEEILQEFFVEVANPMLNQKDVLSFQYSYLSIDSNSTIANTQNGFFVDLPKNGTYPNKQRWDISDIEEYQAAHPNKVIIHWTTSLSRSLGTTVGAQFNDQMRAYARENGQILFDVADILSHDPSGLPCYDNRDGRQYCNSVTNCENHADDRQNIPAICQRYTTEIDGGHLGSVSGAKIQLAKAFWVLMAQIAGWRP